jgi:hypothetical protein
MDSLVVCACPGNQTQALSLMMNDSQRHVTLPTQPCRQTMGLNFQAWPCPIHPIPGLARFVGLLFFQAQPVLFQIWLSLLTYSFSMPGPNPLNLRSSRPLIFTLHLQVLNQPKVISNYLNNQQLTSNKFDIQYPLSNHNLLCQFLTDQNYK